ncbi:hypothetical protein TSOC_009377, partial [Tetrabaena socialis]
AEDVLVSWLALVFLTLQELGVPRDREQQQQQQGEAEGQQQASTAAPGVRGGGMAGASGMAGGSAYLRGMLGYVRQTLGMYDEGQTLARVAGLQGLVMQASSSASSPFLQLMQQYTRLVLLTVEVVAAAGLDTARPIRAPETVLSPSGYVEAFAGACNAADLDKAPAPAPIPAPASGPSPGAAAAGPGPGSAAGAAAAAGGCPPRGLSVRLLMSFMGAVLGSGWSLGKFVEGVRVAYDQRAIAGDARLCGRIQNGPSPGAAAAGPGPGSAAGAAAAAGGCPPRGLSVRLLMSFMGAVLGSGWSLGKFVEGVRVAYDQGLAADELFSLLDEREFAQSGGLLPIATPAPTPDQPDASTSDPAAPARFSTPATGGGAAPPSPPPPPQQITKALLSSWISLSYMTLAQVGVPYPEANSRLGWAWAGFGGPEEALGMNDFVGNVLRGMAGQEPRGVPQQPQGQQAEQQGQQGAELADGGGEAGPAAARAEAEVDAGRGPLRDSAIMVRVADESLPSTSTAFRVLKQQVVLVQAIARGAMAEGRG